MTYGYHQEYAKNNVETATPEGLVLMLYDGCISFLVRAETSWGNAPREEAQGHLYKAQDIVCELMSSLDFEQGGDIASNLFRIYEYMNFRLAQASIKNDPAPLEEVKRIAADLREAWRQAAEQVRDGRNTAARVASV